MIFAVLDVLLTAYRKTVKLADSRDPETSLIRVTTGGVCGGGVGG